MKIACENTERNQFCCWICEDFTIWGCSLPNIMTICKHLTTFLIFFSFFFSSSSSSYSPDTSVLESTYWPGRGMRALLPLPAEDGDRGMQWNVWCDDKMEIEGQVNRWCIIDQEPRSFIQVKSHKRFDGLNMLGWGQKSIFHVAAGSHPVRVAGGSQNRGPKNTFIQVKSHKDKTCSISLPGGYLWWL